MLIKTFNNEKEKYLIKNELIFNHVGKPHFLEKDGGFLIRGGFTIFIIFI